MHSIIGISNSAELRYGWIDGRGNVTIPTVFHYGRSFSHELAVARRNEGDCFGYIDLKGEYVIAPVYQWAQTFIHDAGVVQGCGAVSSYGLVDRNGKAICKPTYEGVFPGKELSIVQNSGYWGCIDRQGKLVIPCHFEHIGVSFEDCAAATLNRRTGFVDKHGSWVIPPRFAYAEGFVGGRAVAWPVRRGHSPVVLIAREGVERTLPYSDVGFNREGRILFQRQFAGSNGLLGPRGFLDDEYNVVIESEYVNASSFSEGFACVSQSDAFFFIDLNGERVFDQTFDRAMPFQDGLARVWVKGRIGYIDLNGNWIWSLKVPDAVAKRWIREI